jgi:hypothetical protein
VSAFAIEKGSAARLVGLLGDLDERRHDLLRAVHPRVVDLAAPDDADEATTGHDGAAHVAERGDGAREERRPEA